MITKRVNLISYQFLCSLPCPRLPCRLMECHTPSRVPAPAAATRDVRPWRSGCSHPAGRSGDPWVALGGVSSCLDPVQPDTHWAPLVSPFLQRDLGLNLEKGWCSGSLDQALPNGQSHSRKVNTGGYRHLPGLFGCDVVAGAVLAPER